MVAAADVVIAAAVAPQVVAVTVVAPIDMALILIRGGDIIYLVAFIL